MSRLLVALFLSYVLFAVQTYGGEASAASYDVNASVPFAAPTQAAVFTSGLDGATVTNAELVLTGACELRNPNTSVSIWRGGIVLGSAPCNGSFSVSVVLQEGSNTLIARSASVSNNYGPDSTPISVTLQLPPTPTPNVPPQPGTPITPTPETINAGAESALLVSPSQPYSVMNTENEIAMDIVVSGGRGPYTIQINWGDGVQETKVVEQLGLHRFTHVYSKPGTYTVKGAIRDVLGAVTTFTYAVVSERTVTEENRTPLVTLPSPSDPKGWWLPATGVGLGTLLAILGYKLGVLSAVHTQPSRSQLRTKKWSKK